ncbi:MAG: hemolysin family protein [Acidobacteriota bacterium]
MTSWSAGVMASLWIAAAVAVQLAVSAVSALLERSGPVRLRLWAEEDAGHLQALHDRRERFNAFRLVLSFLAKAAPVGVFMVVLDGALRMNLPAATAVLVATACTLLALMLSEVINRLMVDHVAEAALRRSTGIARFFYFITLPLVLLFQPLMRRPQDPPVEDDEASDSEIEAFIDFGKREGILEPEEEKMVWGIVDLNDTQTKSVMTPRIDITCASADLDLSELAELFLTSGHSRIPLYRESIDHIVGILHIRDALRGVLSGEMPPAISLAKPPFIVPETKRLDELLKEMQAGYQQVAIVVDEYGGTAGLVTVEDLLEEIVGEIVDEHEVLQPPVNESLPDGSWRFDGRTHIEEMSSLVGVDFGEVPFETVGGLVLSVHGDVPEEGQVVETSGLMLTVERVDERRIQAVRVENVVEEVEAKDG